MWQYLRCGRKRGWPLRFKRQSIICGYIADFYCPAAHVAIEVDGGYHDPLKDAIRDRHLRRTGFLTVRFTNAEVFANPSTVQASILRICFERAGIAANPKTLNCMCLVAL